MSRYFFIIITLLLACNLLAKDLTPAKLQDAYAAVAEKTMPAIVTVYAMKNNGHSWYKHSIGSGFIISAEGVAVTNFHVIKEAAGVIVQFHNGRSIRALIVGNDKTADISVLKIDTDEKLPYLRFADTRKVKVGHHAIAIGSPFTLSQTMTTGIVSNKGRSLGLHYTEDFIQTDAAINPGNSGGPLLDINGNVIGINNCTAGGTGIGFAIDGNLAKKRIAHILRNTTKGEAFIGVAVIDRYKKVIIDEIMPLSPAAKAGLKKGDIITHIDSKEIKKSRDVSFIAKNFYNPGDRVYFTIIRNGKTTKIPLTFSAKK